MLFRLKIVFRYIPRRTVVSQAVATTAGCNINQPKKKLSLVDSGIYRSLPDAYKKFYREWKVQSPKPVHYMEENDKYCKDEKTGQIYSIKNYPIPLEPSEHEDYGIWGGEAVIAGYRRLLKGEHRVHDLGPCPKYWYPELQRTIIYSEVLHLNMVCDVTKRAIVLINQHNGLDYYLLENPACDLRNLLAVKLKRKILLALFRKTLYENDEVRREEVYDKYKKYLDGFTPEEIEWYGLTLLEARKKLAGINTRKAEESVIALKQQYRKEFIEELKFETTTQPEEKPWFKRKLLPFK